MCLRRCVIAKNLDDVLVYKKAVKAADAVSAILKRPALGNDRALWDQLSRSSGRVAATIAEGFGQLTDRHTAVYLGNARGSAFETRTHLRKAVGAQYITPTEFSALDSEYDQIGRMLTRWINYLRRCDWKQRS